MPRPSWIHRCTARGVDADGLNRLSFQIPIFYKGVILNGGYRIDLLVEDEVIVELKAVEVVLPVHLAQLLSCLRLTDKRLGLLINFNVPRLASGVKRVVNRF